MEDDSDNSILIAQDSSDDDDEGDDDAIHDDDVDIGFRRHHVSRKSRKKKTRQQAKDEAIYGVFLEEHDGASSSNSGSRWSRDKGQVMNKAPIFVAASKKETTMEPPPTANTGTTPSSTPAQPATEMNTQQDQDQKAADDYFHSLLQQAQDRKRKREAVVPPPSIPTSFASGPSDKATPNTAPSNAPSATGSAPNNLPVSKDPSVAKWEKHTKGIGSKLLAKMGWKGSGGLGSSRRRRPPPPANTDGTTTSTENFTTTTDAAPTPSPAPQDNTTKSTESASASTSTGISQPIQVVVRPANMGLGFGNFKEMSQLKSNRQIEAEVRGVVLEKDKSDKKGNESSSLEGVQSSAIPSTQQLLTQQVWKRRRRNKKQASAIVTPAELVEASDVATPTTTTEADVSSSTSSAQANLPLGQELLHNLTFLVQTQENQLYSNTQMARSNRLHIQRLTDEVEDWKRQEQQLQQRREQLQTILDVMDRVQDAGTSEDIVYQALPQLHASLEEADRRALSFWSVLAPTLLSPTIQAKLDEWDPVASPHYWDDWKLEFPGLTREEDVQGLFTLQQSILQEQILPRVQQVLESHRWDPTLDVLPVVELYESLTNMALAQSKVLSSLDKSNVGHDDGVFAMVDESSATQDKLRRELLLQTIFPKLQQALHHWKPRLEQHDTTTTGEMGLYRPLDRWILPWIPLLREMPAVLPSFISECHRKLRMALTYLPRTLRGTDLVQCALRAVQPWASVLDSKALQRLSSEHISPVLSQVLVSESSTLQVPPCQERAWQLLWQGHRQAVVSDVDFLSLLEGEVLRWADRMLEILASPSSSQDSPLRVARSYLEWKQRLMEPSRTGASVSQSTRCVREDARLCGILYSVLWMIQQATTKDKDILNDIHLPTNGSFTVISARRGLELQKQVEENGIFVESRSRSEAEARLRLKRRDIRTPSFRDVVEEFAKGHGVLFQPRMGGRALEDGKQVYLFGKVAIYLDGDVVFANKKVGNQNAWRPISMDQLLSMSVNSAN